MLLFGLGQVAESPRDGRYLSSQAYHHVLRSELARAQDDLTTAADELRLALVYDPRSPFLARSLVELTLSQGQPARARRAFERHLRKARDPDSCVVGVRVYRALGLDTEARRHLRRCRRRHPNSLALGLTAAVLQPQGRARARLLRRLAQQHPQAPEPLMALAEWTQSTGQSGADQLYTRALRRDPTCVPCAEGALRGLVAEERTLDEAGLNAVRAGMSPAVMRVVGEAQAAVGAEERAASVFAMADALDPAPEQVARAWLRQGYGKRALAWARAPLSRARAHYLVGADRAAFTELAAAADGPRARALAAAILYGAGKAARSQALVGVALGAASDLSLLGRARRAAELAHRCDRGPGLPEATFAREGSAPRPTDPPELWWLWASRSLVSARKGEAAELRFAVEAYRRAPDHPGIGANYAEHVALAGDEEHARKLLTRLVRLHPRDDRLRSLYVRWVGDLAPLPAPTPGPWPKLRIEP